MAPTEPGAPRWRLPLALFCVAVLGLLAAQVAWHGPVLAFDQQASLWWAAHRQPWLTSALRLVSATHETVALLLATALLMLWRALAHDRASLQALLAVPATMLLNVGLKESFQRARPVLGDPLVHLSTYSFPSGHAAGSTAFYGMACAVVFAHTRSRAARALALAVAVAMVLLVSFSRVYLGAHYPSDVTAGMAEGLLCVLVFLRWVGR